MTLTTTELLLEATGIRKAYGAVLALKNASLAVRPGEVHALMGANGAGKSTLVKILTGAVRPDAGTLSVRGREFAAHSPAEARRGGIVSVYQEPALIPDLDIRANLRLTETPIEPFRHWLNELGLEQLDLSSMARRVPLASLRVIDLARAMAIEPDVLMLDEMTAALPANLTERVLEVIGRQRGGDRSVIFISHRMIEIAAVCDRATVLREGETVGVVDVTEGSEERIVELMLGHIVEDMAAVAERAPAAARSADVKPRISARSLAARHKLQDVSFDLYPGEVLGVVALEGQGQDELFDILAGSERPSGGELLVDGSPVSFRHPADAIRAGLVYVPADRAEALLMQRSVRENISLPWTAWVSRWGPINTGEERRKVDAGIERLQIDTRAQGEVRRLSGGNQQKVTIARWVAGGVHAMLCFDPTRGIDIRTKQQIYVLLRDLAEAGAAVLLYTSELKEIRLACDRAIVIFGGRVVAEIDVADADEPTLLRAAYNLRSDAQMPEEIAAEFVAAEAVAESARRPKLRRTREAASPPMRRQAASPRRPGATDERHDGPRRRPPSPSRGRPRRLRATQRLGHRAGRLPGAPPGLHQAHPAELRGGRRPGPGDLRATARACRRRAGDRRHLRRDRPLDRRRDGPDERRLGLAHEGPVRGVRRRDRPRRAPARARPGRHQRWRGRHHPRARHRRDPRDVVRLGGLRVARAEDPRRRLGEVAQGPGHRVPRQRVDPEGCGGPDPGRGADLDPHPTNSRGAVHLCDRQQPAGRVPKRRAGRPNARLRLHADGPVRRTRRPGAHGEHRDRDAGARALHPAERCGRGPRGREPRWRPRRRVRADRRGRDPPADPHRHDVPQRQHQPLGRPAGPDPDRRGHVRQPDPDPAGSRHERRSRHLERPQPVAHRGGVASPVPGPAAHPAHRPAGAAGRPGMARQAGFREPGVGVGHRPFRDPAGAPGRAARPSRS